MLSADFPINLYAAAALQNVTATDPEASCARLRKSGCDAALVAIITSTQSDDQVKQYATAALANLRASDPAPAADPALEETLRQRRLQNAVEAMRARKAAKRVNMAARRWLEIHRAGSLGGASMGASKKRSVVIVEG